MKIGHQGFLMNVADELDTDAELEISCSSRLGRENFFTWLTITDIENLIKHLQSLLPESMQELNKQNLKKIWIKHKQKLDIIERNRLDIIENGSDQDIQHYEDLMQIAAPILADINKVIIGEYR